MKRKYLEMFDTRLVNSPVLTPGLSLPHSRPLSPLQPDELLLLPLGAHPGQHDPPGHDTGADNVLHQAGKLLRPPHHPEPHPGDVLCVLAPDGLPELQEGGGAAQLCQPLSHGLPAHLPTPELARFKQAGDVPVSTSQTFHIGFRGRHWSAPGVEFYYFISSLIISHSHNLLVSQPPLSSPLSSGTMSSLQARGRAPFSPICLETLPDTSQCQCQCLALL